MDLDLPDFAHSDYITEQWERDWQSETSGDPLPVISEAELFRQLQESTQEDNEEAAQGELILTMRINRIQINYLENFKLLSSSFCHRGEWRRGGKNGTGRRRTGRRRSGV